MNTTQNTIAAAEYIRQGRINDARAKRLWVEGRSDTDGIRRAYELKADLCFARARSYVNAADYAALMAVAP